MLEILEFLNTCSADRTAAYLIFALITLIVISNMFISIFDRILKIIKTSPLKKKNSDEY
jgi:hypothetical protein